MQTKPFNTPMAALFWLLTLWSVIRPSAKFQHLIFKASSRESTAGRIINNNELQMHLANISPHLHW